MTEDVNYICNYLSLKAIIHIRSCSASFLEYRIYCRDKKDSIIGKLANTNLELIYKLCTNTY